MKISKIIFLALFVCSIQVVWAQDNSPGQVACCYIQSNDFTKPVLTAQVAANTKGTLAATSSIQLEQMASNGQQRFQIIPTEDGFYYIKNIDLDKVMTVSDNRIYLAKLDHGDHQKFELPESTQNADLGYMKPKGDLGVVQISEDGKIEIKTWEVNVMTDHIPGQKFLLIDCDN